MGAPRVIPRADPTVPAVGQPGVPAAAAGGAVVAGVVVVDGVRATDVGEPEFVPEAPQAASAVARKNAAGTRPSDLRRDVRDLSCASMLDALSHFICCPLNTASERYTLVKGPIMACFWATGNSHHSRR